MLRFVLIAWLALCGTAHAQLSGGVGGFPGPGTVHSAGVFVGPGDVIASAKAGYSFRAWTSAVRGTNAVRVCNAGDVACVDMVTHATTGNLVITTVGGTDCSVSTCTVKTLYDQSGGLNCSGPVACDVTQATEANRPIFKTASCGGKPCMQCVGGSATALSVSSVSTVNAAHSAMFVADRTSGGETSAISSNTSNLQIGYNTSANTLEVWGGTGILTASATDSAFHAVGVAVPVGGATTTIYVDGSSSATGSTGSAAITGNITLCNISGGGRALTGFFAEGGFWSGDQSASFATLSTNQHSYYGF